MFLYIVCKNCPDEGENRNVDTNNKLLKFCNEKLGVFVILLYIYIYKLSLDIIKKLLREYYEELDKNKPVERSYNCRSSNSCPLDGLFLT